MEDYEYLEKQLEAKAAAADDRSDRRDANGSSKDREKDRDDDRERRRSSSKSERRSKSRDHRRRSRSRDRERDRDRRRSRSRDRRDRRDLQRDSRDDRRDYRDHRGGRGGYGNYERPVRRERTPPEERMAREKERELKEMDRATRTVFASNVHPKAVEKDIFEFFSQAGTVQDIKLITDKNTKRSRGMAYIEYATQEEVFASLTLLNGQVLMGMPVTLKTSEIEKNLAWEQQQQMKQQQNAADAAQAGHAQGVPAGLGSCRLQVSNLHEDLKDIDFKEAFEQFGFLELIHIVRDPVTGASTGVGFVQFREFGDGVKAMQYMNARSLGGKRLEVQMAPSEAAVPALPGLSLGGMALPGMLGGLPMPPQMDAATAALFAAQGMALPGPPPGFPLPGPAPPPVPPPEAAVEDVAEDEGKGGLRMDAQRRAALMQRLAAGAGLEAKPPALPVVAAPVPAPVPQPQVAPDVMFDQGLLGPASPIPTQCILLKNMFDAAEEEANGGPDWVSELEADVRDECAKFGQVQHIHVDRNSKGFVYVRFAAQASAEAAQRALNLRWFSGKQIVVAFQFVHSYASVFGA
mmetsp:Transcript_17252/g.51806  ORF Transcript_17252/g.51806 Transcript_17252/m.51806 type:complete len:577 (-) Transcript_17252:1395-3125(-)